MCLPAIVPAAGGAQQPTTTRDQDEVEAVETLCQKAGLGRPGHAGTAHFLAIGDAPDAFRHSALKHAEALAADFLRHFRERGFRLEFPSRRLTVVVLKDQASYAALLGEAPGKDVGGHYDLETNRLVIFDFRPGKDVPADAAERLNLFTLVHETAHQLSFNLGMFDRSRATPLCLTEGIATYVELWRPGVRNAIGTLNRPRLQALHAADDWIPVGDLLGDDALFRGPSEQLAYAESWLLVHHFLVARARVLQFRGFLDAIRDGGKRASAEAERQLGSLARLDRVLKDEARRYLRA